jgi:dTDP-4-dehydrorhamnose 3,5-epimerase
MSDSITKTSISGLLLIERPTYSDERGFFHEIFRKNELEKFTNRKFEPVQWSHSYSLPKVIRAIHTEEWQKIIYPVSGKMFAAFVDVRPKSKTFKKVETFVFDKENKSSKHFAFYVGPGIGNSICVMGAKPLHYMYIVDEYWDNSKAKGIAWDDPDLAIPWPVKNPIISERDKNNPTLREIYPEKFI